MGIAATHHPCDPHRDHRYDRQGDQRYDPHRDHLDRVLRDRILLAFRPEAFSQMAVRFHRQEISGSPHDLLWKERSWWPPARNLICRRVRGCLSARRLCLAKRRHANPDLTAWMALHFPSDLNRSPLLQVMLRVVLKVIRT